VNSHAGLNFYRGHRDLFCSGRIVRPLVWKTVTKLMETIIVGVIALLLFIYLFVAMIRPEKF